MVGEDIVATIGCWSFVLGVLGRSFLSLEHHFSPLKTPQKTELHSVGRRRRPTRPTRRENRDHTYHHYHPPLRWMVPRSFKAVLAANRILSLFVCLVFKKSEPRGLCENVRFFCDGIQSKSRWTESLAKQQSARKSHRDSSDCDLHVNSGKGKLIKLSTSKKFVVSRPYHNVL